MLMIHLLQNNVQAKRYALVENSHAIFSYRCTDIGSDMLCLFYFNTSKQQVALTHNPEAEKIQ